MGTYAYPTPTNDSKPAKPSLMDIRQLFQEMQQFYAPLKRQQDDDHRYYHLKNMISTPMGYDAVLPPTARTLVNDAADHIASAQPSFTVPRAKRTAQAQKDAETINRWMKAAWGRLNENKATPIHRTACVHALAKGMLALHVRYLPELLPEKPMDGADEEEVSDYEAKQRLAFPFEWTAHDPRYVYPDPGTGGQIFVIEHFQKTIGQVQLMHPEWGGWRDDKGKPKNANEPVEWIYYCDRYWRAYIAGSEFVSFSRQLRPGPVPHGLGFVPWVVRSAGLSDDSGLPDERYQSMLYIVRPLLDEQARVWTQAQAITRDTAWPWITVPMGAHVNPGGRKVDEVPQDLIKDIKMQRPDAEAPKAVLEWINQVEEGIEHATYSSVVTGRAPSGQRSGYSVAVLAGMARVKFGPIKMNVESACAEAMRKTLLLVENKVKDQVPIYIGGDTDYTIGPNDIKGYERVDCDIDAQLVQDRAADADIGVKAYGIGMALETVLKEFFHVENPEEEMEKRYAEDLLQQPAVKALMTVMLAKKRGDDPALIQTFMEATGMTQPGTQQPPGQTSPGGTPAGPPTGMAGTAAPGGGPGANPTPSIPLSGPTSPLGPAGSALQEVASLPRQFSNANLLNETAATPLG